MVHRGCIPNENEKPTVLPVVCFAAKCPRKGSHRATNRLANRRLHGPAHGNANIPPHLAIIPQMGGRAYLPDVNLNTA